MMDVLSVFFHFLPKGQLSLSSSIRVQWSSALDFGPSEDVSVSSRSSGLLVSLGLWLSCRICLEDSLIVFSKMCSSGVDLFSFILVLSFSSTHTHMYITHWFICDKSYNKIIFLRFEVNKFFNNLVKVVVLLY